MIPPPQPQSELLICPSPATKRGDPTLISSSSNELLYISGNAIFIKSLTSEHHSYYHMSEPVVAATFSHDYKQIAAVDNKGMVHIVRDGRKEKQFMGLLNATAMKWAPTGLHITLVGSNNNGYARVFEINQLIEVSTLQTVNAPLVSVCYSVNGGMLAVGDLSGIIRWYQCPAYKFIKSQSHHKTQVNALAFGWSMMASASGDKSIALWSLEDQSLLKRFENAHDAGIYGLQWLTPDSLVTVGSDKKIKTWLTKPDNLELTSAQPAPGRIDQAWHQLLGLSVSGNKVFITNLLGNIFEYEWSGGLTLKEEVLSYSDRPAGIELLGDDMVVFDMMGKISVYKSHSSKGTNILLPEYKGFLCSTNDGQKCYGLRFDQMLVVVDENRCFQGVIQDLGSIRFIACCGQLFCAASNSNMKIWQGTPKNKEFHDIQLKTQPSLLSAQKDLLFLGTVDGHIYCYSESCELIHVMESGLGKPITAVATWKNYLIAGDSSGTLRIWEREQWTKKDSLLGGHRSRVTQIIDAGSCLITCALDGQVQVWNEDFSKKDARKQITQSGVALAVLKNNLVYATTTGLIKQLRLFEDRK